MRLGSHRDPTIRREERVCEKHGRTTFAAYTGGANGGRSGSPSLTWSCMMCNCDKFADYRARIASGEHTVVHQAEAPENPTRLCEECFIALGEREPGPRCGECS